MRLFGTILAAILAAWLIVDVLIPALQR